MTKTIKIRVALHHKLKVEAAARGLTMQDLAENVLQRALDSSEQLELTEPPGESAAASSLRRVLYTDAGTADNGGPRQCSRICLHDGQRVVFDEEIGNRTNNEAEILAIARAIKQAGTYPTTIKSDSQLAVNMVTGKWKGKKPHLQRLVASIFVPPFIEIEWIPREQNPAGWHLEQKHGF